MNPLKEAFSWVWGATKDPLVINGLKALLFEVVFEIGKNVADAAGVNGVKKPTFDVICCCCSIERSDLSCTKKKFSKFNLEDKQK